MVESLDRAAPRDHALKRRFGRGGREVRPGVDQLPVPRARHPIHVPTAERGAGCAPAEGDAGSAVFAPPCDASARHVDEQVDDARVGFGGRESGSRNGVPSRFAIVRAQDVGVQAVECANPRGVARLVAHPCQQHVAMTHPATVVVGVIGPLDLARENAARNQVLGFGFLDRAIKDAKNGGVVRAVGHLLSLLCATTAATLRWWDHSDSHNLCNPFLRRSAHFFHFFSIGPKIKGLRVSRKSGLP